jgi:hypothetical protein
MKVCPVFYYFRLVPDIFLCILFSETLNLYCSFKVRNQDSEPYKITDKIIVLHFLIFVFLDGSQEDERFWTEW